MKQQEYGFDNQIIDGLSEITPPEYEIGRINPFSVPIEFVTWGLVLTTLHLNFLYLQHVLPIIGAILIFLGFRSLRNANIYFKVLWVLSIVKPIHHLADIIVKTTPLNLIEYPEITLGLISLAFNVTMFLIFHKGLKEVYKKANRQMESSPLISASIWMVAAFIIAISPFSQSWLIFIPMIILYILIIRSLLAVGKELDDTGYILANSPVKISNRTVRRTYFLLALAIVIGCNVYFGHLKLKPQEYQVPSVTEARQHLLNMGFPSNALQYLGDQDVAMLKGAKNIETFDKLLMFDSTKVEHQEGPPSDMYITHTYEPGKRNMEVSTIYIEVPDNTVYIMHYFNWTGGRPIWYDGIVIHGAFSESEVSDNREKNKEIISSSLFYKKKGIEYIADFPRLICEQTEVNTMFGSYVASPIRAGLSFPLGSKDQGGYVLYRYKSDSVGDNVFAAYSTFNYIHRLSPLGLPYFRTEEKMLSGGYEFLDELNQHYTTYDSQALKDIESDD
ncbi:MAG TPA: hypothetical protein VFC96_05515 [Anaerovoracaceae bacterium]|nr:hypothetical protein [Anaerovoracaceae bacterium]